MPESPSKVFSIRDIMSFLPHRYPFLLVDRVVEVNPGVSVRAYKNLTINEPFFQGHFPELPVMPGVLIIEAMAQAGCFVVLSDSQLSKEEQEKKLFLFTGMEMVRFRHPVYPGDRLDLECKLIRHKLQIWKLEGRAYVDGKLAAQAILSAAWTNKEDL